MEQRINLKELLGFSVRNKDSLKDRFAKAVIDRIKDRTAKGKAIGGKATLKTPYSDSYAKSAKFKEAGKSKSKVNMKLDGDMLGSMDTVNETAETITIGFEGETENKKAFNHNTGDTVPKRRFFGVTLGELRDIAKKFKGDG